MNGQLKCVKILLNWSKMSYFPRVLDIATSSLHETSIMYYAKYSYLPSIHALGTLLNDALNIYWCLVSLHSQNIGLAFSKHLGLGCFREYS